MTTNTTLPSNAAWNALANNSDPDNVLFVYANQNVLLVPPRLLRRFDQQGERFYYIMDTSAPLATATFYVSTTTFVKRTLPTGEELIQWMKQKGDSADRLRDEAGIFGTLMHIAFSDFHKEGWDFDTTEQKVYNCIVGAQLSHKLIGTWTQKLNKSILAYAQWMEDYQIEPILVEAMLASDELGIGGTLDEVCYAKIKGERLLIQVDFKSGGIYQSAEAQLVINNMLFEENFQHLEIQGMYSWSPKDWRDKPTYTFKDQGATRFTPAVINAMKTMYTCLHGGDIATKTFHNFSGKIQPGGSALPHHQKLNAVQLVAPTL